MVATGIVVFVTVVAVVLATSLFKTVEMSDKTKNLIATVLSVIGGIVLELTTSGFDFSKYAAVDVFGTVVTVYGGAQLIYNFILKGTKTEAVLTDTRLTGGDKA